MDTAIAVKSDAHAMMVLIEKIVLNPEADVAKLQQLLAFKKELEADDARKQFNVAFSDFKSESVKIIKGTLIKDGPLKGKKHANLFDVVSATTPNLSKHGLAISWKLTKDEPTWMEITCTLRHIGGHSESVSMGGAPDSGPGRNAIQSRGSSKSYLERYTATAILGLAAQDADDDGAAAGPAPKPIPGPTDDTEPTTITPDVVKKRGAEFIIKDKTTGTEYVATLESIAKHTKAINAKGGTMRLFFDVRDGKNIISSVE